MNPYAPYAPPPPGGGYNQATALPTGLRAEGALLVVPNGAPLPPICLKCAATQPIEWRAQKFSWVPPWARMFGALIQVFVVKRSRLNIPLCAACNRRWKMWTLLAALAWLPGVFLLVVGGALSSMDLDDFGAVVAVLGGLLLVGFIVVIVLRQKRIIGAAKIDKTHTWLRGVHAQALQATTGGAGSYPAQGGMPAPATYGSGTPYGAPPGYGGPPPGYGGPPPR